MQVSHFSENSLKSLHLAIRDCLEKDNALEKEHKDFLYGVKVYSDWKEWRDILEKEMTDREISFEPIEF